MATIEQGARTGAVTFQQIRTQATGSWNIWWRVLRLLGFVLVGLAVLAIFPGLRRRYSEIVMKSPWRAPESRSAR